MASPLTSLWAYVSNTLYEHMQPHAMTELWLHAHKQNMCQNADVIGTKEGWRMHQSQCRALEEEPFDQSLQ